MSKHFQVEIDVIRDNSPFFIRQFHAKEEDKASLGQRNEMVMLLGILKEGFSA